MPDFPVDHGYVLLQHFWLQKVCKCTSNTPVIISHQFQYVPSSYDSGDRLGLLRDECFAEEDELVGRRTGQEDCPAAEKGELRDRSILAHPSSEPPLAGVGPHRSEKAEALADEREAE